MSESATETPEQTSPASSIPVSITLRRKKKTIPVIIPAEESEDGTEKKWTLKELFGDERDAWIDIQQQKIKVDPKTGQAVGVTSVKDVYPSLISRCLFDENDKPVPIEVIRKLPAECQDQLFDACQALSGLDKRLLEAKKKQG